MFTETLKLHLDRSALGQLELGRRIERLQNYFRLEEVRCCITYDIKYEAPEPYDYDEVSLCFADADGDNLVILYGDTDNRKELQEFTDELNKILCQNITIYNCYINGSVKDKCGHVNLYYRKD